MVLSRCVAKKQNTVKSLNSGSKVRHITRFFTGNPFAIQKNTSGIKKSSPIDLYWRLFAASRRQSNGFETTLNPSIDNPPYAPERMVSAEISGRIEKLRLNIVMPSINPKPVPSTAIATRAEAIAKPLVRSWSSMLGSRIDCRCWARAARFLSRRKICCAAITVIAMGIRCRGAGVGSA